MHRRKSPLPVVLVLLTACSGSSADHISGGNSDAAVTEDAGAPARDSGAGGSRSDAGGDAGDPADHDAGSGPSSHDAAVDTGRPSSDAAAFGDAAQKVDGGGGGGVDAGSKAVTLGYYTGEQGSYNAVAAFSSYLKLVSSDVYDVTTAGAITGGDSLDAGGYEHAHGIQSFACISNYSSTLGDFDPALGHAALVTNEATVVANAVAVAESGGYNGVNIDFESIAYSTNVADDRAAYSKFIHDLATALHGKGLKLIISVPAKTDDSPGNSWDYPYDYAALGADVDYLQMMTYDENGPGWSAPGPVSGADWVETTVKYAITLVPKEKILIGLPAYGYDWDLTASNADAGTYKGSSISWTGFAAVTATAGAVTHRDTASSTPYVDYTSTDGHKHEFWYEDPASITTKTQLVAKYAIAGYSMWSLGQEDLSFWQAASAGAP